MNVFDVLNAFWDKKKDPYCTLKAPHGMLWLYLMKLANNNKWEETLYIPTDRTMEACGIGSYKLYKKTLDELEQLGLIKFIEKSHNQFTCNRIALVILTKADTKASTKASSKHLHHINTIVDNNNTIEDVSISEPLQKPKKQKKNYLEFNHEEYTEQQINDYSIFNNWVDNSIPQIRKIDNQLTIKNFVKYQNQKQLLIVKEKLLAIAVNKKYLRDYNDLNLVLANWIK